MNWPYLRSRPKAWWRRFVCGEDLTGMMCIREDCLSIWQVRRLSHDPKWERIKDRSGAAYFQRTRQSWFAEGNRVYISMRP